MNASFVRFLLFAGVIAVAAFLVGEFLEYTRERNAIFNAFYNISLHGKKFDEASSGTKSPVEKHVAFSEMYHALRALDLQACPSEFCMAYDEYVDALQEMADLLGDIVQVQTGIEEIEGRQLFSGFYKVASGLAAVPSSASRVDKCVTHRDIAMRKMRRIAGDYGLKFQPSSADLLANH